MKKLMIALAAVAIATCSQAATYAWKWTSTLNDANGTAYAGTVYVFNAQDVSQSTILSTLQKGQTFDWTSAIDNRATSNGKGSDTVSIDAAKIGTLTKDASDFDAVDYFFAAVFKDTTAGKDYVFLTDTYQVTVEASQATSLSKSLSGAALSDSKTIVAGKNWYDVTQSVPEPTSGLLLLLGVAGLALRRKQK